MSNSTNSDTESSKSSVDRKRSRSRSKHRKTHKHKSRKHRRHSRNRDSHRRKRSRSRSYKKSRRHRHSKSRRDKYKKECSKRKVLPNGPSQIKNPNVAIKNLDEKLKEEKLKWESTNVMRLKQIEQTTGVTIPKYINPSAINAAKYAETMQKRKLLWSNKDHQKDKNAQVWSATSIVAGRGDQESAAKFRKLMGIHDESVPALSGNCVDMQKVREQEKLFERLDADYESGRSQTHTSRGVGLGYNNSSMLIDPSLFAGYRKESSQH